MIPFLSIIVPVYKVEKYLARCIESVVNQSFTDWELLLVDDGIPDGGIFVMNTQKAIIESAFFIKRMVA